MTIWRADRDWKIFWDPLGFLGYILKRLRRLQGNLIDVHPWVRDIAVSISGCQRDVDVICCFSWMKAIIIFLLNMVL